MAEFTIFFIVFYSDYRVHCVLMWDSSLCSHQTDHPPVHHYLSTCSGPCSVMMTRNTKKFPFSIHYSLERGICPFSPHTGTLSILPPNTSLILVPYSNCPWLFIAYMMGYS
ncbi:uncharacterized protein WM277_013688 isoform 1-T1 [Molossus nigricans]